eukprot:scaffold41515_cov24-Tisochrysis_lutea.AAC.1
MKDQNEQWAPVLVSQQHPADARRLWCALLLFARNPCGRACLPGGKTTPEHAGERVVTEGKGGRWATKHSNPAPEYAAGTSLPFEYR